MIGVVANANAGKSTLVNAILGEKVLPTSYKCCTSVITNVKLIDIETPTLLRDPADVEGAKNIRKAIKDLNNTVRLTADAQIHDVSIYCKPKPKTSIATGLPYDGELKLVDMPGVDETDNDSVKKCFEQLLSMCHGLWILTKHDAIKSDGLANLINVVLERAPHLMAAPDAITFLITHVDSIRCDDDSDDEVSRIDVITDLKNELRGFLKHRLPQHPTFVEQVRILGTGVDENLIGHYDFPSLFQIMSSLHTRCKELKRHRKLSLTSRIVELFGPELSTTNLHWPESAHAAINKRDSDRQALAAIAAVSGIVSMPFGAAAAVAGCAARGTVAVFTGLFSIFSAIRWGDRDACMIGGQIVVGGAAVDAVGVKIALERLTAAQEQVVASQVEKAKSYQDVKLFTSDKQKVLYIGQFKKRLPHGTGRLFWERTQYEAFIGRFVDGNPMEGIFLNEEGFYIGNMKFSSGSWEVSGYQADELSEDGAICIVCMHRPSLQAEQKIFSPCGHGNVCSRCAKPLRTCPTCGVEITHIAKF